MANLPKSLHTVTVLVNVARLTMACGSTDWPGAIKQALVFLGYDRSTTDTYGLATKALAIIIKEQNSRSNPLDTWRVAS